jgi:AcrR family transcriptional regulator
MMLQDKSMNRTTKRAKRQPSLDSLSALQLITAAADLMRERDSLDISFVDISERAELPQGLISYYFGNKEGLLYAVLEKSLGSALSQLDVLANSNLNPAEKMRLHLHGVVTAYFRTPFFNRLLQSLTRNASADRVQLITDKMVRPMIEAQGRIIDEGIEQGLFRPVDKMLFYFATVGAADGLHSSQFILKAIFSADFDAALHKRNSATIADIFMRALLL